MKYVKGNFVIVPNLDVLKGQAPSTLAVYLWICSHADEDGSCFPSRKLIADEAGVDIKTVDRIIPILEELGVLQKRTRKSNKKDNLTNIFQILLVEGVGVKMSPPRDFMSPPGSPTSGAVTIPTLSNYTHRTSVPVDEDGSPISKPSRVKKENNSGQALAVALRWQKMVANHLGLHLHEISAKSAIKPVRQALEKYRFTMSEFEELFQYFLNDSVPEEKKGSPYICLSDSYITQYKISQRKKGKTNAGISGDIKL